MLTNYQHTDHTYVPITCRTVWLSLHGPNACVHHNVTDGQELKEDLELVGCGRKEFDWAVSVLHSRCFIEGPNSTHMTVPGVDMANHSFTPNASVRWGQCCPQRYVALQPISLIIMPGKHMAQLVFVHFKHPPKRSLGLYMANISEHVDRFMYLSCSALPCVVPAVLSLSL